MTFAFSNYCSYVLETGEDGWELQMFPDGYGEPTEVGL